VDSISEDTLEFFHGEVNPTREVPTMVEDSETLEISQVSALRSVEEETEAETLFNTTTATMVIMVHGHSTKEESISQDIHLETESDSKSRPR